MANSRSTFRQVILHADDFGMNAAVNAGILRAFREGCLTSTSLLVNAPSAEDGLNQWRELQAESESSRLPSLEKRQLLGDCGASFDLGWHLNLTQGMPLTDEFPLALRSAEGSFLSVGKLYARLIGSGSRYRDGLQAELSAQLQWMLDRGFFPTHVNGHQYVELIPVVSSVLADLLKKHAIRHVRFPCESSLAATTLRHGEFVNGLIAFVKRCHAVPYSRRMSAQGFLGTDRYFGTAHAGRVSLPLIQEWLRRTEIGETVEIGLHPAESLDRFSKATSASTDWDDPLANLRPAELSLLISPELVDGLRSAQVQLGRLANRKPAGD